MQGFNEQSEKLAELAIVLLVGAMLPSVGRLVVVHSTAAVLLLRSLAVSADTPGEPMVVHQRAMILLVRDPQDPPIGSVFYLMFAIRHGVTGPLAQKLITPTLATVAEFIVVHGVSVRLLMNWYVRRKSTAP